SGRRRDWRAGGVDRADCAARRDWTASAGHSCRLRFCTRCKAASGGGGGSGEILEGEFLLDLVGGVRLAVNLDVGIDKEIQRLAVLLGHQYQVAALAEGDAVLGQVAEVVVLHLW